MFAVLTSISEDHFQSSITVLVMHLFAITVKNAQSGSLGTLEV
jgi:hypothetical protein